jgi:hypothetical protein
MGQCAVDDHAVVETAESPFSPMPVDSAPTGTEAAAPYRVIEHPAGVLATFPPFL